MRELTSTKRLIIIFACLCIAVTTWLVRKSAQAAPDALAYRGSAEPTQQSELALREHRKLLEVALAEPSTQAPIATKRPPSITPPDTESAAPAHPARAWGYYRRTSMPIVRYIMDHPDRVNYKLLVRHKILNARDMPIPRESIDTLRFLVSSKGKVLTALMNNYRRTRSEEIRALIDSGVMKPASLPRKTDDELKKIARLMSMNPRSDRSAAECLADLREEPQYKGTRGQSFTKYKGKVYLWKDIESLPHSDKMLSQIHHLSYDLLGHVLMFFESRFCIESDMVVNLMARANQRNPAESRHPFRKGRKQDK